MTFFAKISVAGLVLAGWSCARTPQLRYENGAVAPAEAAATYQVAEGFKVELIASEPLVADPVDMEIDEYGNCYVVEMPGYPLDMSHTGRIKLLRDKDGDGVMDESVLFADQLMFPNGVLRWKKGLLVTDAPNVLYLEDSDGDGRADIRDTLLTGFSLSNPHVNVNNPVYGLDNWVYLAHFGKINPKKYKEQFGDAGEEIRFPGNPDAPHLPQNAGGRSVRFKPGTYQLEQRSSRTQFGHSFDPWGHIFLTHNQNHIYSEVIRDPYVRRNPELVLTDATEMLSDHGKATEVFQITTNPDRQLFTPVGLTTSSSGITLYTGGAFPPPFGDTVSFVAESVSNLVHADILKNRGATFRASRHQQDQEFLASTDSWARPVNMYIGPDGALYVLDYYRRIIEHPEWMSDDAVEAGGLYDGAGMGRIYRISPVDFPGAEWTRGLALGDAEPEKLLSYLGHSNSWWRLHAQRLLIDQMDKTLVPPLEEMATGDSSAYGRLHALWTLEGMGELKPRLIVKALKDPAPGVRENAVRLAEPFLRQQMKQNAEAGASELLKALYALEHDTNPKVRFQLLCTLGYLESPEAAGVRERILFQDIDDPWVQIAALSAASLDEDALLSIVLQRSGPAAGYASLVGHLTAMIGAGDDKGKIVELIRLATSDSGAADSSLKSSILAGLAQGLGPNESSASMIKPESEQLISAFFDHPSAAVRNACLNLLRIAELDTGTAAVKGSLDRAMWIGADKSSPAGTRAEALAFLALADPGKYREELMALVVPGEEQQVQVAALAVLGKIPGDEISRYILANWKVMTPGVRDAALNTFLSESSRVKLLLEAIEQHQVSKAALGWPRTVRLMQNKDPEVRSYARVLLTSDDSEAVNKSYEESLQLSGNAKNGREVFKANCAVCHQVRSELGTAYGPDLGTVHNWLPKDLLANILDPALAIAPGYDLWEVTLHSGESFQGMIKSETASAIQFLTGPGAERTVNRQEIKSLGSNPMSLMPSFGGVISQQEMADLITFLRNSRVAE